jgi:membrane-bound lytic murein transglycosylase D
VKSRAVVPIVLASVLAACGGALRPASSPAATRPPDAPVRAGSGGGGGATWGGDSIVVSETEVTRRAVEVFGDLMTPAAAADTAAPDTDIEEVESPAAPTWDIDVRSYETHARVEHYVNLFGGPARGRLTERLERGTRYDAMLRAKFLQAGLPEDMTYLALIESGYNPHAYSKAAAVGMWQFMTSTARGMGLRVDWWVDERRDPVRSTDAAIRFITWLKEQTGSLYLAAAAYNGGPGRVARGLTRYADDLEGVTGDDMFFALAEKDYLPAETKNYVPQLIAAALVAKDPAKYGFELHPQPPYVYDSVQVAASTPLGAVALAAHATGAEIAELNPHVLRGMTPPGAPMYVRIPLGRSAGFDSAFAALGSAERTALTQVAARKGQSLASLARDAGISARQLAWYNPKAATLKGGRLRPGQAINVPAPTVVTLALDIPDPAVERYGTSKAVKVHVVKRGESLRRIAQKYGTTVSRLKALNSLRKTTVFAGQSLVVKGPLPKASAKSKRVASGKGAVKTKAAKAAKPAAARGKRGRAAATGSAKKAGAKKASAKTVGKGKAPRPAAARGATSAKSSGKAKASGTTRPAR